MPQNQKTDRRAFYVQGMHCASCEILIENKLLGVQNIKFAEASLASGKVFIEYAGEKPNIEFLNELFKKDNYIFSEEPFTLKNRGKNGEIFLSIGIALLLVTGFVFLNKIGLSELASVTSSSSLPAFFLFGLLAGISSCAALIGGMVLSMSKQWTEMHADKKTTAEKFQPHLLFNVGRLAAFTALGSLLGLIGNKLQISLTTSSILIIGVSVIMFLFGLQMMGLKSLQKIQLTAPKFTSRFISDEKNFKGRWMPFLMGALTFFLPCGFTITAQGLALISGNPYQGALIMTFFALGTAPTLVLIGLSSIKFSSRPHTAYRFTKIAGILVLFFALFNINNQLNVLGAKSLNDLKITQPTPQAPQKNDLPEIVDGKQLLKMEASSAGYQPNNFKVKAGIPVRWEITDKGTSGCTNAVISRSLFDGQINLTPGETSVKEFIPQKTGKYKFSCWMGMISGTIEVVN